MRALQSGGVSILVALIMFTVFPILTAQVLEKTSYLKFSDQEELVLREATNFAILESGVQMELPTNRFMICGSIFIRYYRGYEAFYTVRKNDHSTLWFSLHVSLDLLSETYDIYFKYIGQWPCGG